jgi:hypothetical protein
MAAVTPDVRKPDPMRGTVVAESLDFDVFDYERSAVAALVGLCGSSVTTNATARAQLPVKSDGSVSTGSRAPRFTVLNECDSNASSPNDSPRVVRRKESGADHSFLAGPGCLPGAKPAGSVPRLATVSGR